MYPKTVIVLLGVFLTLASARHGQASIIDVTAADFTGSRSGPPRTNGLAVMGGTWLSGVTLSWEITDLGNERWEYEYTLDILDPANTRYFLLQIGDNQTLSDFSFVANPSGRPRAPMTYGAGGSNFGMHLYGIKFDRTSGDPLYIRFMTSLSPIWGAFVAGAGNKGCPKGRNAPPCINAAWNYGLTVYNRSRPEPGDNFMYWVPTPGGFASHPPPPTSAAPEPGTLILLGAGLLGIAAGARRRLRKPRV